MAKEIEIPEKVRYEVNAKAFFKGALIAGALGAMLGLIEGMASTQGNLSMREVGAAAMQGVVFAFAGGGFAWYTSNDAVHNVQKLLTNKK